jgi:hypothetical protein
LINCVYAIYERKLPREHDVRDRTRIRGELPQTARSHPLQEGPIGNPRGRPPKNLPALLAAALNEKVTVIENGKRPQVTKREAVIAQLVNKSASAELRATKILIDMQGDRRGSPIAWFAKGLAGQPQRGRGNCQREIEDLADKLSGDCRHILASEGYRQVFATRPSAQRQAVPEFEPVRVPISSLSTTH